MSFKYFTLAAVVAVLACVVLASAAEDLAEGQSNSLAMAAKPNKTTRAPRNRTTRAPRNRTTRRPHKKTTRAPRNRTTRRPHKKTTRRPHKKPVPALAVTEYPLSANCGGRTGKVLRFQIGKCLKDAKNPKASSIKVKVGTRSNPLLKPTNATIGFYAPGSNCTQLVRKQTVQLNKCAKEGKSTSKRYMLTKMLPKVFDDEEEQHNVAEEQDAEDDQ